MNGRLFNNVSVANVEKAMIKNGYPIDRSGKLNIANIRSSDRTVDTFNDVQILWWYVDGIINAIKFSVTVDPGLDNILNPINVKGCAIVAPGFYHNVWALGKHKGKYDALVQVNEILVFRDSNKDAKYDYTEKSNWGSIRAIDEFTKLMISKDHFRYLLEEGIFGINCHRANQWKIINKVGLYSAGCVVHEDPKDYVDTFIPTIKLFKQKYFSAAWIDSNDLL